MIDTMIYDFLPFTREFDELGHLYYVERLILESNTNGQTVTPTISYRGRTETLTTFSSTTAEFDEISVGKLGPIDSISLTPISRIAWYGVEMHIRPVQLGVQLVHTDVGPERKNVTMIPGRTSNASSYLAFDIHAFSLPEDTRHISTVPRYLWLDIKTGAQTVTPVLVVDAGTETTLTAITASTRTIVEFSILSTKRIKTVRLDGDFTHDDVVLWGIELDLYIPNKRRMAVG